MKLLLVAAVLAIALQRLLELRLSKRNERRLRARGAVESGRGHYPLMVAVHALWLASTLVEGLLRGPDPPGWWYVPLVLFLLAQPLRYWALSSLGDRWSTRVLVVPGERLVSKGPYRYLKHPNYAVVAVEILTLPLVFGCWATALVFTASNALVLYLRIKSEERALSELRAGEAGRRRIR